MNNNGRNQTYFDSLVTDKNMQFIKVIIPFMDKKLGGFLGVYIKFMELQNAMHYIKAPIVVCNADASEGPPSLMDEFMNLMDDETRENLEMMMTLFSSMGDFSSEGQDISDYMENLKNLF